MSKSERNRRYREKHKDEIAEYQRAYYLANREQLRERQREYYEQNSVEVKGRVREYRLANPERSREHTRRKRARRREAIVGDSNLLVEFSAIVLCDPCAYCGARSTQVDHIEPLAKGGDHDWSNITGACATCNNQKQVESLLHFIKRRSNVGLAVS